MEYRIAKIITFIFHPVFLTLYFLLLLFSMDFYASLLLPLKAKVIITIIVIFTTLLLPGLMTYFFYRLKLITSIRMISKDERIYPLLVQAIFFYMTYYLLKQNNIPVLFSFYMLGATFLTVCALVINFYYKISLHMIGMGGIFGFLLGLSFWFELPLTGVLLIIILLSGLVGAARLKISTHKISEIYSGFLVGSLGMIILFLFL